MANLRSTATADRWSLWQAAVASVLSRPGDDEDAAAVKDAARKSYQRLVNEWVKLYKDAIEALGWRFREIPGLTEDELVARWTSMVLATADGFTIRMGAELISTFDLPTGPSGATESWDDFSFALWQALPAYVENPAD